MKTLLLAALATICFAATTEPRVPRAALNQVEAGINDRFRSATADPWDLLGAARGSYLPGYGALFTVELELVFVTPLSPFKQTVTKEEVEAVHQRKLKKLPQLRDTMRAALVSASNTLTTLPGEERVAMEAFLWNYKFEDTTGLPRRVMMSAPKQKLAEAVARHASNEELAALIDEQEQ